MTEIAGIEDQRKLREQKNGADQQRTGRPQAGSLDGGISHRPSINKKASAAFAAEASDEAPGDDLLLHGLSHTTIGAGAFHFRVRDGIGWDHTAKVARELVRVALVFSARSLHWDLGRNEAFRSCRQPYRRGCEATWSYMVKPHGSLVSVSSALLRYTPDLSTT